jgi:uncharacterized protein with HEPN domain
LKANRTIRHHLDDIALSMERIIEYIGEMDFTSFSKDHKTVDAVIRNFEIIGEASKNLPSEFKENHPTIPWSEMYYLRNKVSHEYFGVDHEIIWDIAKHHLPDNLMVIYHIIKTAD